MSDDLKVGDLVVLDVVGVPMVVDAVREKKVRVVWSQDGSAHHHWMRREAAAKVFPDRGTMLPHVFRRADKCDTGAVTLKIWQGDSEIQGIVRGPTNASEGGISFEITSPLPVSQALGSAVRIANTHGVEVVVVDPEELWDQNWGALGRAKSAPGSRLPHGRTEDPELA